MFAVLSKYSSFICTTVGLIGGLLLFSFSPLFGHDLPNRWQVPSNASLSQHLQSNTRKIDLNIDVTCTWNYTLIQYLKTKNTTRRALLTYDHTDTQKTAPPIIRPVPYFEWKSSGAVDPCLTCLTARPGKWITVGFKHLLEKLFKMLCNGQIYRNNFLNRANTEATLQNCT